MATGTRQKKKSKPAKKPVTKKKIVVKAKAKRRTTATKVVRTSKVTVHASKVAPKADLHKKQISVILKKAIKGEEDGLHFYSLLAEKSINDEAKRKLEGLRDDESRHKVTLVAMHRKYVGGELGKLPARGINALRKVFAKGHLDNRKTEMDFITLAIEAELAATKYYREQRGLVADPKFKEIFDQLADEEHGHFELLQAEKDALSGNYNWFAYGDTAPLED
jgi:rubrerythrin